MTATSRISIVVPCYNEQEALPLLVDELVRVLPSMNEGGARSFELVIVDDGSRDATVAVAKEQAARVDVAAAGIEVAWVSFSRNFGKEAALLAGLEHATGDYVAVMDADLQDPPSLLPRMAAMLDAGECDVVGTCRTTRAGEPPVRSFFAHAFYKLVNKVGEVGMVDGARDFRMMRRCVVDAILSLPERSRFSKGIFNWVGFRTEWIAYENVERAAGQSKWSFFQLLAYALDGLVAFSTAPLAFVSFCGIVLCFVALLAVAFIVVRTLLFGDPVAGWPSLACLVTFIGGLQLLCLGVIGQYLAKVYAEVKQRPAYVVAEYGRGGR